MKRYLLSLGLVIFISFLSFSQILEPVKWNLSKEDLGENVYELVFKASIEDKWHLYSQFVPKGGPEATAFYFYDLKGFEFIGEDVKIVEEESYEVEGDIDYIVSFFEPDGHEEDDPNFNMILKYFGHEAKFTRRIKITTEEPLVISGYVYFMCCDDSKCLPPNDENKFEFAFNGAELSTETVKEEKTDGGTVVTTKLEIGTIGDAENKSEYKQTYEILEDKTVLERAKIDGFADKSLWELFIFSILAGLAAILTPCVFPMIPMTVSFFMKEKKAKGKMQAIVFGTSIILIYTVVGTVIAVTLGVNFANWLSTTGYLMFCFFSYL